MRSCLVPRPFVEETDNSLGKMLMLLSVHVTSVSFSTVQSDYGLLLELHTLTLFSRSYVLLLELDTIRHMYLNFPTKFSPSLERSVGSMEMR